MGWITFTAFVAVAAVLLVKRLPQFAVLALAAGLLDLVGVGGGMWALWFLVLVTLVVTSTRAGFFASMIPLAAALAFVGGSFLPSAPPAPNVPPQAGGETIGPPTDGPGQISCPPQFVQRWDRNLNNRFVSAGLWDNPETRTVSATGADRRQRQAAAGDARYLASVAHVEGLWSNPNMVRPLLSADGRCLSADGQALYSALTNRWDRAEISIQLASAQAVNTEMAAGRFRTSGAIGTGGDRRALVRSYPSGQESTVLVRCANPVLPPTTPPTTKPPTTPPTTPPETTKPPTTPPETTKPPTTPPTTPPETTKPPTTPPTTPPETLTPKDPADSRPGPSGKPTAPAPTGEPESLPPVETRPAQPSDKPGDPVPSDVVAPGATTDPERTETPVPPPLPEVAPPPSDPGTNIPDPDGAAALPLLALGAWSQRKLAAKHQRRH